MLAYQFYLLLKLEKKEAEEKALELAKKKEQLEEETRLKEEETRRQKEEIEEIKKKQASEESEKEHLVKQISEKVCQRCFVCCCLFTRVDCKFNLLFDLYT